MARSKKNASLLHPIDTVMHWYAEAQAIPAGLKKSFEGDKEKALQLIKKLTTELKHAKDLEKKAAKQAAVKASRALVKEAKAHYQSALHKAEKLAKELQDAKTHLAQAKFKQKYFHALETAFSKVTKLFAKKHRASTGKKKTKRRAKVVRHAAVSHAKVKVRRRKTPRRTVTVVSVKRKLHAKKHVTHKRAGKRRAATKRMSRRQ